MKAFGIYKGIKILSENYLKINDFVNIFNY